MPIDDLKYYLELKNENDRNESDPFVPFLQPLEEATEQSKVLVRDALTGEVKEQSLPINVQSDYVQDNPEAPDYIKNKPDLNTAGYWQHDTDTTIKPKNSKTVDCITSLTGTIDGGPLHW